MAKNAYVEISSEEAQKISGISKVKFDKEKFLEAIEKFTEKNEFQVNRYFIRCHCGNKAKLE